MKIKSIKIQRFKRLEVRGSTSDRLASNYDYELKIANRGDVSVQIVSLACDSGATLEPDEEGQLKNNGRLVDYNGLRIGPGERESLLGEVNSKKSSPVTFTITLRMNEKDLRLIEVPVTRTLTAA